MDDNDIETALLQANRPTVQPGTITSDSRDLDRLCERIAKELISRDTEPGFTIDSADFGADAFLICADRYWYHRFMAEPTVRTAAQCARWLHAHVSDEHKKPVLHKWALGYAFVTKDSVESSLELSEGTENIVGQDDSDGDLAYFCTLYHAGKLRSNFWHDELYQFLESSLLALAAGRHRNDPLFTALRAFGAYGSRTRTVEHARDLYKRAWNSPERPYAVTDICLNALAASHHEVGELLRAHARIAVDEYPESHIFHFRLATGRHLCGEHDAAAESIGEALRLLPAMGSRGSHKQLQEQYLAKREAITESRQRAKETVAQEQRLEKQMAATEELQRAMRSSTVRAIELVTIFTAAIAFAVGSLQITLSGTLTLAERVWTMVVLGGGLLAFAALIITVTWLITRRRE